MKEYNEFTNNIAKSGHLRGGNALHPTSKATTVRLRGKTRSVTDGPFAETKEQLGGYCLIEVKDLDEALSIAERIPSVRWERSRCDPSFRTRCRVEDRPVEVPSAVRVLWQERPTGSSLGRLPGATVVGGPRKAGGFSGLLDGAAGLRQFLGQDGHDVKAELWFFAEEIEQPRARDVHDLGFFEDFCREAVRRIGKSRWQAHHRSRTEEPRRKAGKIAFESESNNALGDEKNTGDFVPAAKQERASRFLHARPNDFQLLFQPIWRKECSHPWRHPRWNGDLYNPPVLPGM